MAIPLQSKKRRSLAELSRRVNDYAYNGRDPTGVAESIETLNGESVLALKFASNQPTPAVSTGANTVGMMGLDANNVIQIPGPGVPAVAVNIGNGGDVTINGQIQAPAMYKTVTYNDTLNASIGTTPFFIADQPYTVIGVNYVNKTAGTGTGTVTITKDTGTAVPGGGTPLLASTISVTAVANTVTPGTLIAAGSAALTLAAGDRLSALFAGTLTTLAGVVITVTLQATTTQSPSETAQIFWRVNGDIATQTVFQANRDMVVTGIKAIYGTAFGAAITIDVTKDTGTNAAGGGTTCLAAPMAGDGTINTVLTPALTATAATLSMAAGDRIAVKFSATTTGALFCLVVTFAPIYSRKEITWQLAPNAQQQVAQCFFVADRYYEIVDGSCIFDVTAGGAAKLAITIDKGTTAPGAGTSVDTTNTNAGFDMNATARTTQFITPAALHLRLLSPGDRLGLKVSGAAQAISLVNVTASLRPNY